MGISKKVVGKLFEGPIDIVGDVHGEHEALWNLLTYLGYNNEGEHPEGRRLVFVGDLVDRGPNSPQVVEDVIRFFDNGTAQCILGNHELNILMHKKKDGNGWLSEKHQKYSEKKGWIYDWKEIATPSQHKRFVDFFHRLPLALERTGDLPLRVVHAYWDQKVLEQISIAKNIGEDCLDLEKQLATSITDEERREIKTFYAKHDISSKEPPVPMNHILAKCETRMQMGNPIKVLTSGVEGVMREGEPQYLSGKYRMVERMPWWETYTDSTPVVFGHYWRSLQKAQGKEQKRLFGTTTAQNWLGAKENTYCIDFSVGRRYRERRNGTTNNFLGQLGALRVPERKDGMWTVALSNGTSIELPKIGT